MKKKIDLNKTYKRLQTLVSIMTGGAIGLFLTGKLVAMPSDFSYSRGVWNAFGIGIIVVVFLLFGRLACSIACKVKKKNEISNNSEPI